MAIQLSSLISRLVVAFTLLSLVNARVVPHVRQREVDPKLLDVFESVPLTAGNASLPPPASDLTVKAITIGSGIQNYTCDLTNQTAVPKSIGAVATLTNAISFFAQNQTIPTYQLDAYLNSLPSYILTLAANKNSTATATAARLISQLPIQGHHFFDAQGIPTFDLGDLGLIKGKKLGDIKAPANSTKGPGGVGNGAVDWLALPATNGSRLLKEVFRVETAGGNPPKTCAGQNSTLSIPYAAQYWFFG
ncbi:hypothetical protein MMC20_002475 [Loxospora ochrophaea]|nr:hypothetical protein [Loxospora ochrophaea]